MNFLEEFQQMAQKHSHKAAVVDYNGTRITSYGELYRLSCRIAARLRKMEEGTLAGRAVLVSMDRRMEYVAAEIGILMAGGAFVPVVPEYPKERLEFIRKDCEALGIIDRQWIADAKTYDAEEFEAVGDRGRALIIYTSGSTGQPKGIAHSMDSFSQGVMRDREALYLDEEDVMAAIAPMSFVAILLEYFSVLSRGGCVHIVAENVRKDVRLLEEYFAVHGITCAFISPRMLWLFKNKGTALKKVATGSERVSMVSGDGYDLFNFYGSSETATLAAYYKIEEPEENTPIGKPAKGLEFFLLDENGRGVADGEEGELCIQGVLGEAYLNLEEQSRRTFLKMANGKVLVHTGDMARKLPDGNYVYINRKDQMVKINGQRVETGEVETRLMAVPGVEDGAVKVFRDENGQNYLCGYYVSEGEVSQEEIRENLKTMLPDYMIPRFFKRLSALPKSANGKLDRSTLLPPGIEEFKASYKEPENDIQRRICQGFEEILHCGRAGRDDDFFRLGGDSINVMKLIRHLEGDFITPYMVLKGRTPEKIAALLDKDRDPGPQKAPEPRGEYPLTDSQTRIYLECIHEPETTMYNIPMYCELPKNADKERFLTAVQKAVSIHPAFGVNVALGGGAPVMRIHKEYLEASIEERETDDLEKEKRDFARPFAMEGEPLYRMSLCRYRDRWYFFFDVHHIIFDGVSVNVFLRDISRLYKGQEPKAEKISLTDMAIYEEGLKETARYQKTREFFRARLEGEDIKESLRKDFKKKTVTSQSGRVTMALSQEFSPMMAEHFTRRKGISENTLFLGAFSYALGKCGGENKSMFCTVDNGRHGTGLEQSTGMFVRTLPIYRSWQESALVDEYLTRFQNDFYDIMSHDCISFEELEEDYGIASDILFVYQGEMFNGLELEGRLCPARSVPVGKVRSNVSVMVMKSRDGYEVSLEYRKDVYRKETMKTLLRLYRQVLKGMLSCKKLEDICLVSPWDVQMLEQFNDTAKDYDRTCTIVDLFRQQARRTPERAALAYKDKVYTYRELDEITDRLAAYVADMGIGREQVVSVLVPRCEYMAIASLGVSKAGAAYEPLDPSYPGEWLEFMMRDARACLLIAEEGLLPLVPGWSGEVLLTKDIPHLGDAGRIPAPPKPEDLFILLYTSDSTGAPKGCMLEHGNIRAFCHWYQEYYGLTEESRVAAYTGYVFDANMMDMYPALVCGAEVFIVEESIRPDLKQLNRYFEQEGITHSFMTTQTGRVFATGILGKEAEDGRQDACSLKCLSMGGESLVSFEPKGNTRYFNIYGPTECTVNVTAYELKEYEEEPPIGKAVSNVKLYVVDKQGRRLPVGVPGELCVAGFQVSRGYLNRPDKTREVYTDNPFSRQEGYKRIYHTGDIVRYLPDGNLQFIGRRDGQVKIRGFRIELAEVEEVIRRFPDIKDTTVAAFEDGTGGKYIAAYVVSDKAVDMDALNRFIKETKPPYMVPSVLTQLSKLPLTGSGKVDKRALPKPEYVRESKNYGKPGTRLQRESRETFRMDRGAGQDEENQEESALKRVLRRNRAEYVHEIRPSSPGNVLLTGANGFLGIHILKDMIDHEDNIIYCLMRKGRAPSPEAGLKSMLVNYFSNPYEELFGSRIRLIEGDITDREAIEGLGQYDFERVINCAACVKHFSSDDTREQVNYQGVLNLIRLCTRTGRELVQISTDNVAGENAGGKFPAEKAVLEAVACGMKGKVIRAGNLMSQVSDEEFRINSVTNGFMRTLRGYAALGKFPVSMLDMPAEFSPVDSTARAIVHLAGVRGGFTVFHAYSGYLMQMADVIEQMNESGIVVRVVSDEEFAAALEEALGNEEKNELISGLIACVSADKDNDPYIGGDNSFTTKALYRLGFKWPMPDKDYLRKALKALGAMGFFDGRI